MGMGRGRAWRWATGRSHAWVGGCTCAGAGGQGGSLTSGRETVGVPEGWESAPFAVPQVLRGSAAL